MGAYSPGGPQPLLHSNLMLVQSPGPTAASPGLSAASPSGTKAPANTGQPLRPVKMTELLQSVVDRLICAGDQGKSLTVLEIAARYKGGEATYQQAMLTMTGVVGREMLVQEVCRLSQISHISEFTSSTGTSMTSTASPSGGGAGTTCTMGAPPTAPMVALRSDSEQQRPGAER
jgi:hypothetical protein